MTKEYIAWTPGTLKRLKAAVEKAKAEGVEVFVFEDKEFFVPYAKYLIEYLEGEFFKVQ
jgi:hypothetical protein